jgi:hypothetical protein
VKIREKQEKQSRRRRKKRKNLNYDKENTSQKGETF